MVEHEESDKAKQIAVRQEHLLATREGMWERQAAYLKVYPEHHAEYTQSGWASQTPIAPQSKPETPKDPTDNIHYYMPENKVSKWLKDHKKAVGLTAVGILVAVGLKACSDTPQTLKPGNSTPTLELTSTPINLPESTATSIPKSTSTPTPEPPLKPTFDYNTYKEPVPMVEGDNPSRMVRDRDREFFPDIRPGSGLDDDLTQYGADLFTVFNNKTPAEAYDLKIGKEILLPNKTIMEFGKACYKGDPFPYASEVREEFCQDAYKMAGYPLDNPKLTKIDPAAIRNDARLREDILPYAPQP